MCSAAMFDARFRSLERGLRRDNVIVQGLVWSGGDPVKMATTFIHTTLGLDAVEVLDAFWLGRADPDSGARKCPLLVRLKAVRWRQEVQRRCRAVRPRGVYVDEDLCAEERTERAKKRMEKKLEKTPSQAVPSATVDIASSAAPRSPPRPAPTPTRRPSPPRSPPSSPAPPPRVSSSPHSTASPRRTQLRSTPRDSERRETGSAASPQPGIASGAKRRRASGSGDAVAAARVKKCPRRRKVTQHQPTISELFRRKAAAAAAQEDDGADLDPIRDEPIGRLEPGELSPTTPIDEETICSPATATATDPRDAGERPMTTYERWLSSERVKWWAKPEDCWPAPLQHPSYPQRRWNPDKYAFEDGIVT